MYDVAVIGGGPAGLSAALVLARQLRRVLVVDLRHPRNQPAAEMHMYLGRDGTSPAAFLADGRAELQVYEGVEQWKGEVVLVGGAMDEFSLQLGDGREVQARRLILTGGLVDVPYDIDGLAERWGTSVFHCPFCHGHENRGRRLAVIGNGQTAALAAYLADRYSHDVVLCTHGPSTVPEQVQTLLDARRVRVVTTPVASLVGTIDDLTLTLSDGTAITCQAVFHRAPARPANDLAVALGCDLLADGTVRVDELKRTSVPGVYAAGDGAHIEAVPEPAALVSTAAAGGVEAAVWLEQELFLAGFSPT